MADGLLDQRRGVGLLEGIADALSPGRVIQRQEMQRRRAQEAAILQGLLTSKAASDLAREQFEWQKQQALQPKIEWKDGIPYQVTPNSVSRMEVGGQTAQDNPYITGGTMNEAQSKDALYASRMMGSEGVFRGGTPAAATAFPGLPGGGYMQDGKRVAGPGGYGVEEEGTKALQRIGQAFGNRFGFNPNAPNYQKFDQAKRDFVNATLRRESGAVISPAEFENADRQYFPIPGDTPEVIAQKRANRAEAIKGIGAGAGRGYKPDYAFDQQGNYIRNPATQPIQGATAQAGSAPVRVTSKAEYDRLPPGSQYMAPDGTMRTKR